MAKSTGKSRSAVGGFASALDVVVSKLSVWRQQRAEIVADIQRILEAGQTMLRELGDDSLGTGASVAKAKASPKGKGGRPKGYVMSPETKAKLKAAWDRRKAAVAAAEGAGLAEVPAEGAARPGRRNSNSAANTITKVTTKKKKRTMSADARARIGAAQKKRWALRKKADAK